MQVRESRNYYFVTVGRHEEIPIAKGIGRDRVSRDEAIRKAEKIAQAREN